MHGCDILEQVLYDQLLSILYAVGVQLYHFLFHLQEPATDSSKLKQASSVSSRAQT